MSICILLSVHSVFTSEVSRWILAPNVEIFLKFYLLCKILPNPRGVFGRCGYLEIIHVDVQCGLRGWLLVDGLPRRGFYEPNTFHGLVHLGVPSVTCDWVAIKGQYKQYHWPYVALVFPRVWPELSRQCKEGSWVFGAQSSQSTLQIGALGVMTGDNEPFQRCVGPLCSRALKRNGRRADFVIKGVHVQP